jgi:hypothetical protein
LQNMATGMLCNTVNSVIDFTSLMFQID